LKANNEKNQEFINSQFNKHTPMMQQYGSLLIWGFAGVAFMNLRQNNS